MSYLSNGMMGRLVQPDVRLGRHRRPAFQVYGLLGMAAGTAVCFGLTTAAGGRTAVSLTVILAACGVLPALTILIKLVTGRERLINYHYQLVILVVTSGLLAAWRQPILLYLDGLFVGIATFMAIGRLGCRRAGCCHGRPHGWGEWYDAAYAARGMAPHLVGVRLFPTQAAEAVLTGGIALVGGWLVLSGRPPGLALAWVGVAYGVGRFGLAFWRGDGSRLIWHGLSEAQWTAWGVVTLVAAAGAAGWLPGGVWTTGAAAGLWLAVLAALLQERERFGRRRWLRRRLWRPDHVREVALGLDALAAQLVQPRHGEIRVVETSLGLRLSAGETAGVRHVTLSLPDEAADEAAVVAAARLVQRLRCPTATFLPPTETGVVHLLLPAAGEGAGATPTHLPAPAGRCSPA